MASRYGERSTVVRPAQMLPPMGSPCAACRVASCPRAHVPRRWMQSTASSRKPAETSSRFVGPTTVASDAVTTGPAIAPVVPPAAMKPYKRFACSVE